MNIVAIIQARMGSERLPGKVLKKVNGTSLLEYQIKRVKQSMMLSNIVIATTVSEKDNEIEGFCHEYQLDCYRGSEDNVLKRYYEAASAYDADVIIRLTADCPLIDPKVIDEVISAHIQSKADYTSNTLKRTYPRGMDTEVFNINTLERAYKAAKNKHDLEHVTPFIYNNPDMFKINNISYFEDCSNIRMTVDVEQDFQLIKIIIEELNISYQDVNLEGILSYLKANPALININSEVEQKK